MSGLTARPYKGNNAVVVVVASINLFDKNLLVRFRSMHFLEKWKRACLILQCKTSIWSTVGTNSKEHHHGCHARSSTGQSRIRRKEPPRSFPRQEDSMAWCRPPLKRVGPGKLSLCRQDLRTWWANMETKVIWDQNSFVSSVTWTNRHSN